MVRVLVTGAAGYVGSHTVIELLNNDMSVMAIDNYVNAARGSGNRRKPESLIRVEKLTGKSIEFQEVDLLNEDALKSLFKDKGPFDCVLHFAALKAVGESCKLPLKYYKNNCSGSVNLLEAMGENGVKRIVFSSSATVYGDPKYLPIDENHETGKCTNPYGKTKFIMEEIIHDVCQSDQEWSGIMLRYFNPVGSHPSGLIGEDPLGPPNNLMPFISQVAVGKRRELLVYGNDFDTPDGTGVRDYIHVMDLASGHVAAVRRILEADFKGWSAINLGTGVPHSVLETIRAFELASGQKVPFKIVGRRGGDVASSYADCSKASIELKWKAEKTIFQMCADAWNWQSKNPTGFSPPSPKFQVNKSKF